MDSEGDECSSSTAAARGGAETRTRRRWFNVRTFTALAGAGLQTHILIFSFQMATITTIQKLYGLSTFKVGLLFCIYEVGEIVTGVFGSYFASRSRKPRVVAAGMLLVALSCVIFAAPHFIFPVSNGGHDADGKGGHDDASVSAGRHAEDSCILERSVEAATTTSPPDLAALSTANSTAAAGAAAHCVDEGTHVADVVMAMYAFANLMLGVGYSPMSTLAVVYIDDNASSKSAASFYQSAFYTVHYYGYIVGHGVAAGALSIHTSLRNVAITASDERWVGAWWLGFVLCAVLETMLAAMLFFFPARLRTQEKSSFSDPNPAVHYSREVVAPAQTAVETIQEATAYTGVAEPDDEDDDSSLENYKDELPSLKELLPALWTFAKNPLFVLNGLTKGTVSFIDAGFFVYLPKYLETQFHQSAALANVQTGLAGSLVSTLTVLLGGWVISKYKPTLSQCTAMVFASYLLGLILFVAAMLFSCPQSIADQQLVHDSRYNCSIAEYYPVCINHTTYYSPCHAGCQNASAGEDGIVAFTGCFCLASGNETVSGMAGVCHAECNSLLLSYLAVIMIAYAAPSFSAMATITVLLRSVKRDLRSFGLGIYHGALSMLAWIPSPMVYGAFVDMTCLTWDKGSQDCDGNVEEGACNQYDNSEFRVRVHTLTFCSLAAGSVLGACTWALASYRNKRRHAYRRRQQAVASMSPQGSGTELLTVVPLPSAQG